MKVEFYKHSLGEAQLEQLREVLASPFLTTGPKTAAFEKRFAEYAGVPHCVGLTSCTAGLFLALKAFDIGPGDEVIVPAMTFMATSNVVLQCGAKPVFVDVEPDTGLIDVSAVENALTPRTKAIIPVHLYGHMADMKRLHALAQKHGVKLIEDAAHAVESERDHVRPGHLADAVAYSFYATKNMACGEGGALTTKHDAINERMKRIRQHGMSKSAADRYTGTYQHWDMLEMGWKYNMSDIQAALLLPQFETLEGQWRRREQISRHYESEFSRVGIEFPIVREGAKSARHLFTVWAPRGLRDVMLKSLQEQNIGVAVNYRAVHLLQFYRQEMKFEPGRFPVAELIGDRTLTIPLYPRLTDQEVEYVTAKVIETYRKLER